MEEKDIEIQHYNIFEIPADCRTEVWSELLYGNIFKFLKVKDKDLTGLILESALEDYYGSPKETNRDRIKFYEYFHSMFWQEKFKKRYPEHFKGNKKEFYDKILMQIDLELKRLLIPAKSKFNLISDKYLSIQDYDPAYNFHYSMVEPYSKYIKILNELKREYYEYLELMNSAMPKKTEENVVEKIEKNVEVHHYTKQEIAKKAKPFLLKNYEIEKCEKEIFYKPTVVKFDNMLLDWATHADSYLCMITGEETEHELINMFECWFGMTDTYHYKSLMVIAATPEIQSRFLNLLNSYVKKEKIKKITKKEEQNESRLYLKISNLIDMKKEKFLINSYK